MSRGNVLILDDDKEVLDIISSHCSSLDADLVLASTLRKALTLLGKYSFDCIVLDIHIAGEDGIEFAQKIRSEFAYIPIVFVSGYVDEFTLKRAQLTQPFDIVSKPFSKNDIAFIIEDAMMEGSEMKKEKIS